MTAGTKTAIIAYNNLEGACAAALLAHHLPDSEILPASAELVAWRLSMIRDDPSCGEVHLAGIGIQGNPNEVYTILEDLRQSGRRVVWYHGKGYLEFCRGRLESLCECHIRPELNNSALCIYHHLYPAGSDDPQVNLLKQMAMGVEVGPDLEIFENIVECAIWRFFNFRDKEAYPRAIRILAGIERCTREDIRQAQSFAREHSRFFIGKSPLIKAIKTRIHKYALTDKPILIAGETGTGKETIARLIHAESKRNQNIFYPVNCAALPEPLLESILFGHLKGSFTGAVDHHKGIFESANNGTIFLDEIGEMSCVLQAKLLRVLQEGTYCPLGGHEEKKTDVRILAATNKNLIHEMERGMFREDLYYRIAVLKIEIPPLRERKDDIPALVNSFLHKYAQSDGYSEKLSITETQMQVLMNHPWRGNVRELYNVLERWAVEPDTEISRNFDKTTPFPNMHDMNSENGEILPLDQVVSRHIMMAYEACEGNKAETARRLGISLNTLKARLAGIRNR